MKSSIIAGLFAAVLLSGCKSDTKTLGPIPDEDVTYPQLTFSDRKVQRALGFQKPLVTETGDGLLQVTVPVRARSKEPLHVEYKPVWLDKAGRPVAQELSWRHLRLEPRQPQNIVVNATSKEAVDYNIQFRWARP